MLGKYLELLVTQTQIIVKQSKNHNAINYIYFT